MHTLCQNYSRPSGYIVRQRHQTLIYVMSLDTDEWNKEQKEGKQESSKRVLDGLFHQVMQLTRHARYKSFLSHVSIW